jgi:hypothetical protein
MFGWIFIGRADGIVAAEVFFQRSSLISDLSKVGDFIFSDKKK